VAKSRLGGKRPRRTRQHVIASLSRNFVEEFIIQKGHTADRRLDDYGYDLLVETYVEDGYVENGEIRIQLKATDRLADLRRRDALRIDIDARHYELWTNEPMPVFLILFDARQERAYWLDIQRYFSGADVRKPREGARTIRIQIPLAHELTGDTIDYMRRRKAEILAQDRAERHPHG
jgi:hypothetical protein